jgi:hypothetical protein
MAFGVLFVLLLGTAGWWLHRRWSALQDARAARREAEMMYVFEARSSLAPQAPAKPAAVASAAASDFYPTLPGRG